MRVAAMDYAAWLRSKRHLDGVRGLPCAYPRSGAIFCPECVENPREKRDGLEAANGQQKEYVYTYIYDENEYRSRFTTHPAALFKPNRRCRHNS